jgi:hypothetical protein
MNAPETVAQINTAKVQQHARKNETMLVKVNKLLEDEQPEAAAKLLLPVYVNLASAGCWYESNPRRNMMGNFDLAYNRLTSAQIQANEKQAHDTIDELERQSQPRFEPLMAELAGVKLSDDGTGSWNGKSLAGPKLASAMFASLQTVCGQTLRAHALVFASDELGKAATDAEKLRADYNTLLSATLDAVGRIIAADAARATADQVPQLYAGYLASVCGFASKLGDASSAEKLSASLDQLAARSEPFAADVAAYRGATSDWLRWRSRATKAAIRARTAKSPAFALKANGPRGTLAASAPQLIDAAMKQLADRPLVAENGLLAIAGETCCSRPEGAVVLRIVEPDLDIETLLGTDLLISKGKIPLTLEAGEAYARARRGNLAAVGGRLQSIELIGTVPLQATDYPERSAIYPADAVTATDATLAATRADQVIYLVTLAPEWIAGAHLFAISKLDSN